MTQQDFGTINPADKSGTQLAADLNAWRDTIHSSHRGSTQPAYRVPGMFWVDDSADPVWALKFYDGAQWIELARFNASTHDLTTGGVFYDRPQTLSAPQQAQARANIGLGDTAMFFKADQYSPVFVKTGNGTISIKAGSLVEVAGAPYVFSANTAVTMPALVAGSDYAIWIKPDGTLEATADFVSPPVANSRQIGGFHYAPGGNATALNSGGNTTPQINEHSIWDIKFRPACPDPRGMALIAGRFWADIYLCGVNHHSDGTSKYNVTIADGSSPPKIPAIFGDNGSNAYSTFNWWEAAEVMMSHGKDLLNYDEFAAAMFGTKEAQAGGTDPVSTILRADYTSKWGIMLATGNMWVWGRQFGGPHSGTSWSASTGGRGSVYAQPNAALFGGNWGLGANAGSRASNWNGSPWNSFSYIGARGRSDHLCLA